MGNKDIASINRQSWLHFFREIEQTTNPVTGKPIIEQSNRALQVCSRVYRFAITNVQGVKGVYNKADYLDDRTKLNQWYSNWLDDLVN